MTATLGDLIQQVREEIDEVTLSGEEVREDMDLEDKASSNFSDASIKERLLDSTVFIVSRVKATYAAPFVVNVTPPDLAPPYDANTPKILRLLDSKVEAKKAGSTDHVEAVRRTMGEHIHKENGRGLNASEEYPVYVFEGMELLVENSTTETHRAKAVRVPERQPDGGGGDADIYGDVTALDDIFEAALVYDTVRSCFDTLRLSGPSNAARAQVQQELGPYRLPARTVGEGDSSDE